MGGLRDEERVRRVGEALERAGLQAVVCALPENVLMLSGYWPVVGNALAIATREGRVAVIAPEDERELAEAGWAHDLRTFDPVSLAALRRIDEVVGEPLEAVARDLGLRRRCIGFEGGPTTEPASYVGMFVYGPILEKMLSRVLSSSRLETAEHVLKQLRAAKTPREVTRIRTTCQIAERAFQAGARQLRAGLLETEAAVHFRALLSTAGAGVEGVQRADGFAWCMSGPNAARAKGAYARSRARPIGRNELVLVHCNSYADGYWVDVTRTYCMGEPDDRQRALYEAVFAARTAALAAIRPGVKAADVDRAAREVIAGRGFGAHFPHPTGHGVGFAAIDPNARPRLHPKSEDVLEAGMVFNVEPAVYFDGDCGLRHCDVIAVTDDGAEILTPFQDAIERLILRQLAAHAETSEGRPLLLYHKMAIPILALILALPAVALPAPPAGIDARVEALMSRLTLQEKLGQLQQLGSDPKSGRLIDGQRDLIRRGRIGSLLNVRGAQNANEVQRIAVEESSAKIPILFGFDVIHGYRTVFPIPLGQASSWDPTAVERAARIAAAEASAAGVRWVFAPMVDIARDPRWGRIAEGAGEDPYLGAVMARARVRGFQGDDFGAPDRVVACAKHWVAYGAAEGGREYNAAEISERTLRTVYFPPFRAALDAGVGTFMTALNTIDGIPATANPFTLGRVLRGEWQFDGLVVSDYNSVKQLVPHGLAADDADAARLALLAGIDMEEESTLFRAHGARLVGAGKVPLARIDEAVRRVLQLKCRLGLFDHPYTDEDRERDVLLSREHVAAARAVAGRSLVLLKNEQGVLPLRADLRSIAVLGPLADDRETPLGHWRGDGKADDVVTLLAGIKAKVAERGGAARVAYAQGCAVEGDAADGIAEAVRLARAAEVAIVAVGESAAMSGEASSRTSLDLTGHQLELVQAVHATGTPTVVVLINGRPLTIGWVAEHVPAILEAWFGGSQGGHAIADALFGDVNPGGKLPVTFPRAVGQVPLYYNHLNTGRPPTDRKYTSKYIDAPATPLFPFGHGLSYTRFRLKDLCLDARRITPEGRLAVSVAVENVGDRDGDEVVQLYIRDLAASVARPVKELRGFERVALRPGESRTVRFRLTPDDLGSYDQSMHFVVEPGAFKVFVGTSSLGGLEAGFEVIGK